MFLPVFRSHRNVTLKSFTIISCYLKFIIYFLFNKSLPKLKNRGENAPTDFINNKKKAKIFSSVEKCLKHVFYR